MMTAGTERVDPPFAADERTMLTAFLDYQRATLRLKCAGLTDAAARRAVTPSPRLTLAGLVSHLRWTEQFWFERKMAGLLDPAPYDGADPDADWLPPEEIGLAELLADYDKQCERSREIAAGLDLDAVARVGSRPATLRWVLQHLIEETARHNGHADLIREFLDGVTGR